MRKILTLLIIGAIVAIFYMAIKDVSNDYYKLSEKDCNKRVSKEEYLSILKENLDDFSLETSKLGTTESVVHVDRIIDDLSRHLDYIKCIRGDERLEKIENNIDKELETYKDLLKKYFEARVSDNHELHEKYYKQLELLGKRLDQYILDYENENILE